MAEKFSIPLSARERRLLIKYAYPFERLEEDLIKKKNSRGTLDITTDEFEWNQAIGNISISMNENVTKDILLEELDALSSLIEFEIGNK